MPVTYEIDAANRRVYVRGSGLVTFDEALENRRRFQSDPSFSPGFDQIIDATGVTRLAISAAEIGLLALDAVFSPGSRRAFVAPSGDTYSFGRTFQLYRQINAGQDQVRLFRTIDEAEAWISGTASPPIMLPPAG